MSKEKEEKTTIKVEEKVTVYATDNSKHYKQGQAYQVHPVLAKKLIASGKATDKEPKK